MYVGHSLCGAQLLLFFQMVLFICLYYMELLVNDSLEVLEAYRWGF